MTRVFADHAHVTGTANDLALLTHGFDACANLHDFSLDLSNQSLFVAVGDASTSHVVGRDLDLHLVTREDSNAVLPHTTRAHGEDGKAVLQLDFKHRIRAGLNDRAFNGERVFLLLRQVLAPCFNSGVHGTLRFRSG